MNGILYVAIGEEHYLEAITSANSVKEQMDASITLVSDRIKVDNVFDELITMQVEGYSPECKIQAASLSPYDKTLMLDTDTYVVADVNFDMLDRFDVAAVFEPSRGGWPTSRPVPDCFPEFNSGVLGFKKCKVVDKLLADWLRSWKETGARGDMGALREALYYSNARLCVLPPEYNYRFSSPACVSRLVRIIHGPGDKERYRRIRRKANSNGKQRILLPENVLS